MKNCSRSRKSNAPRISSVTHVATLKQGVTSSVYFLIVSKRLAHLRAQAILCFGVRLHEKFSFQGTIFRLHKRVSRLRSRMSKVSANIDKDYYLQHHGIIEQSTLTTKFRVVFDSAIGTLLNQNLMVGPVIQYDLCI